MRHPQAVPSARPTGVRRALARLAGTGAALTLLLAAGAGHAVAHDVLLGSDPEDGAVLTEAPEQVVLTFSASQTDIGTQIDVRADGEDWSDGPPVVDGATVTQPLREGMPAGQYTIQWRSVASDGHPVSGELTFSLDLPAEPEAEPEPEVEPEQEAEPEPEPAVSPTPTAAITAGDPDGTAVDAAGPAPWLLVAGAVAVLAVVAGSLAWWRRAANREAATELGDTDE